MEKELTFSEKISLSWKDPKIRALRLTNRSKNKSWMASRKRCAQLAAEELHSNHKDVYVAGQKKHSSTMLEMFKNPKFKAKHLKAVRVACKNELRNEKISKSHKAARKAGLISHRFWESANKSNGPSRKELKIVTALNVAGLKHVHQFNVPNTLYVADIYFPKQKLIVEVDGHPYHYTKKGISHGRRRDRTLRTLGFSVMHLNQKALDKKPEFVVDRIESMIRRCA